jgi:pullulanase/glycogen debranching enzyme
MHLHPKWKIERFAKEYDTYSPKEIKKFCKGDPYKWGYDNACKMVKTFDYWDEGEEFTKMSKERRQLIEDMTHQQLAIGGYRLAHILNRIFK